MLATQTMEDRYISFEGIDCQGNARRMMLHLDAALACQKTRWVPYFEKKLAEKQRMGHDDLYFVGSQINCLRTLFEDVADTGALELLDWLEDTCC
ncbi:MAG: N(2)-fixation sustaining protein CowN [Rhodospirillaceae bacterium]